MAAPVVPVVVGGFFAWGIYRRVRRNIGRQPLRLRRIVVSLVIFSLLSVLSFVGYAQFPKVIMGFGAGLVLGAGLGFAGLRLTKFEVIDGKHFYTPNTHIGLGLTALFAGRMIYRFWVLNGQSAPSHGPAAFQSPLTLFFFGLIAGYYLVYYTGLFIHTRDRQSDNVQS